MYPKSNNFFRALFNFSGVDWVLVGLILPVVGAGLITMHSFGTTDPLFTRQLIWIAVALLVFFFFSTLDMRFLKNTKVLVGLLVGGSILLVVLLVLGQAVKGAASWLDFGAFSFQPADFMKIVLVLLLAKYFSRRHIEIANVKHILISGLYMFIPFALVFFQPDFGSAVVLFLIWFGMILVAGISKKHLFILLGIGVVAFLILWFFVFAPYQKARIASFIHPLEDIRGSGYNAYQSTIAVGSGQVLGKGVGYGTQSRLNFLPEYETDFIFAAFAEEWGFFGAVVLLILFAGIIWRILKTSMRGSSNFEMLYGVGIAIFFMSHIIINIGMNIGLLPVTGLTLPFVSYGGSHLLTEFMALGILMSMRKYSRTIHKDDMQHEFLGI